MDPMKNKTVPIDLNELDRQFKMIKNELFMKRALMDQLRTQLDEANSKNYELNKVLEKTQAELNETKLNVNLISKKCEIFENKFQKNRELLEKNQLQREIEIPEKETLKKRAGQLQMENYDLKRELDELKMRYKYEIAFRNDLNDREAKLKTSMQELRIIIEKLTTEHELLMRRIQKSQDTEKVIGASEFIAQELEKMKKEKAGMEATILELSAKCQKFEELFKSDLEIVEGSVTTKLIFRHWQNSMEAYKRRTKFHDETINELTRQLTQEREAGKFLMERDEENAAKIQELQKALDEETKKGDIKCEIIELDKS